jgi:hypothetical protein
MKSPRVGNMSMSLRSTVSHFRMSQTVPMAFAEIPKMQASHYAQRVSISIVMLGLIKNAACARVDKTNG